MVWSKQRSATASEPGCHTVKMRADFLVGHQVNQEVTAFTPVLPQPKRAFYVLTKLLQRNTYEFIAVDV